MIVRHVGDHAVDRQAIARIRQARVRRLEGESLPPVWIMDDVAEIDLELAVDLGVEKAHVADLLARLLIDHRPTAIAALLVAAHLALDPGGGRLRRERRRPELHSDWV